MSVYRDKKRGCFVFEFSRRIEGRRVRTRKILPKSWNQAQADAFDRDESAKLYAVARGIEGKEPTIDEAVARYLKERVPQLKRGKNVEAELALMFWAYQGRPLSALPDVCKAYQLRATRDNEKQQGKVLSPATLRNRIRYLTAACRYAWREYGLGGDQDPAARVTVPEVRNERQLYIGRAEMLKIAKACKHRTARMAIRIAFYSGMRLSEILKARIAGPCWVLDDSKNGNPRLVPIHPKVAVCARKFKPCPKITIQSWWRKARKVAGREDLHFHDLRHSAASELVNAGVDLYTVGRVLGHKDSRSTQRYAHLAVDTLTAAVGMIGKKAA
ncbi:Site-specific recombinase XerD [Variovorax sp. YR752]|uniref:tyrosine-type recombinase/integrase n=1 Tax=Variovorax sp. YR752 TaxID=1884383 RepID=UPI000BC3B9C9|nr:site-specific integrase [Variovorax sp. YR752]SOD25187.1 Site-specific recombinase XerD [Variovorax sp. YR752]